MSIEAAKSVLESGPKKRPALRPLFVVGTICAAVFFGWVLWPSTQEEEAHDLSRADGRSRFCVTSYSKRQMPPNLTLRQRLFWLWMEYNRRRGKPLGTFSFPAASVRSCSIQGLLYQCMEVTGTRYLIAVEIVGTVDFGTTNVLTGGQWVQAFERAIESSKSVICYAYGKKRNLEDTLLVIHERPGLVKILPASKFADDQKAGLVRKAQR